MSRRADGESEEEHAIHSLLCPRRDGRGLGDLSAWGPQHGAPAGPGRGGVRMRHTGHWAAVCSHGGAQQRGAPGVARLAELGPPSRGAWGPCSPLALAARREGASRNRGLGAALGGAGTRTHGGTQRGVPSVLRGAAARTPRRAPRGPGRGGAAHRGPPHRRGGSPAPHRLHPRGDPSAHFEREPPRASAQTLAAPRSRRGRWSSQGATGYTAKGLPPRALSPVTGPEMLRWFPVTGLN